MKTFLSICLLFIFQSATCQNAYYQTKELIAYNSLLERPDLDKLMEIYVEKLDFGTERRADINTIKQFTLSPFEVELDMFGLPTYQLEALEELIEENRINKEIFWGQINTGLIGNCFENLDIVEEDFLYDDKIVFESNLVDCYNNNLKQSEEDIPLFYLDTETTTSATTEYYEAVSYQPAQRLPSPLSLTTRIIDGTSQYLVDRVKEELLLAFFDQFLTKIDSSTELKALLPDTYFLLKSNDLFHIPSMGEVWMTAFQNDLKTVPAHFQEMVFTHPDYAAAIKDNDAVQIFGITALALQYASEDSTPLQVLDRIYDENQYADSGLINSIGLASLLRKNLGIGEEYETIDKLDFMNLMKYSNAADYFTALVYHQDQELFNTLQITQKLQNETPKFINKVAQLYSSVEKIQSFKADSLSSGFIIEQDSIEQHNHKVLKYVDAILEFVDFSMQLVYFKDENQYFQSDYYTKIRPISEHTLIIFDAANKEEYGQMVLSSMYVLGALVEGRIQHLEKQKTQLVSKKIDGETLSKRQKRIDKEIQTLEIVVKDFMFYAGFMIDVIDAESSLAIKGIIEKYATPVGSYRSNRERRASVSISAYPGFYTGYERIVSEQQWAGVTGITAPIGFAINFGNKYAGRKRDAHALGLFLPVVDIAAPFSYRWKSDTANEGFPDDIRLHQIFSPGAYAVWGVANLPISFKLGAQYTPELRTITVATNDLQKNTWRVGLSATIDIPIFFLFRSKQ